jgi:hypothetical protein
VPYLSHDRVREVGLNATHAPATDVASQPCESLLAPPGSPGVLDDPVPEPCERIRAIRDDGDAVVLLAATLPGEDPAGVVLQVAAHRDPCGHRLLRHCTQQRSLTGRQHVVGDGGHAIRGLAAVAGGATALVRVVRRRRHAAIQDHPPVPVGEVSAIAAAIVRVAVDELLLG